jgi:two-component system, cell cycle response regulator
MNNRNAHWAEQTMGFEGEENGPRVESAMPYLVMYSQRNMGKRLDLSEAQLTVGRSPNADIVVDDRRVSKIHCTLQYRENAIHIQDNDSTNGTFLNGERITNTSITGSALLQIGGTVMKLEFKNKAEVDYEDELLRKATTDALTGIANRHYFMTRAREEIAFARRTNILLGLAMLDIDFFKQTNDTYGHQAGDYVLNQFACLVNKRIRNEDIFGRYGGEEFVILMRGELEPPGAKTFCERVRAVVEQFDFRFNETHMPITVSIGLCLRRGGEVQTLDEFINAADKALYRAKSEGRNRVVVV